MEMYQWKWYQTLDHKILAIWIHNVVISRIVKSRCFLSYINLISFWVRLPKTQIHHYSKIGSQVG